MQPLHFFRDNEKHLYAVPESGLGEFEALMKEMPYQRVERFRDAEGVEYDVAESEREEFAALMKDMPHERVTAFRAADGSDHKVSESERGAWAQKVATAPAFEGDREAFKTRMAGLDPTTRQAAGTARIANETAQAVEASLPFMEKAGLWLKHTGPNLLRAPVHLNEAIVEHGAKAVGEVLNYADTGINALFRRDVARDEAGNPDTILGQTSGWFKKQGDKAAWVREQTPFAYTGEEVGAHVLPQLLTTVGESLFWAFATGGAGLTAQGTAATGAAAQTGLRALAPKIGHAISQHGRVAAIYGLATSADISSEAREKGYGDAAATGLGLLAGTIEAVLEGLTDVAGLQRQAKNTLRGVVSKNVLKFALNAIGEGSTEFAQELSTETIRKLSDLSDAQWSDIFTQALISGAYGMGASVIGEGIGHGRQALAMRSLKKAGLTVDSDGKLAPDPAALPEDVAGVDVETGDVTYKDGTVLHRDGSATTAEGLTVDQNGEIVVKPDSEPEGRKPEVVPDSPAFDFFGALHEGEVKTLEVPVDAIAVNDRIPQFKEDADPRSGVVHGQELEGTFKRLPVKPIVVIEFADGKLEVVTGRHRLDLARRNQEPVIPAAIIKEADGWTIDRARLLDAYDNIIDEKGSIQDYIRFFEGNTTLDEVEARKEGLLARPKSKDAWVIAREATPDIRSAALAGKKNFSPEVAAAIARHAPASAGKAAEGIQRAAHREVLRGGLDADETAILTSTMMHDYRLQQQQAHQDDLFGVDDTALQVMAEKAKVVSEHRRDLERIRTRLSAALTKKGDLELTQSFADKIGIKDRASREEVQAALERVKAEHERWQKYFNHPELLEQVDREVDARRTVRMDGSVDPHSTTPIETENGQLVDAATLKQELELVPDGLDEPGDRLFNNSSTPKKNRTARNLKEAEAIVKSEIVGRTITNENTGMDASVSNNAVGKMFSLKAQEKSANIPSHIAAAINVDTLFETAVLEEIHPDTKNRKNVKDVYRFRNNFSVDGKHYTVKITVVAYTKEGNRIYTIETVSLENSKAAGTKWTSASRESAHSPNGGFDSETGRASWQSISRGDVGVPIDGLTKDTISDSGEGVNPPGDRLANPSKGTIEKTVGSKKRSREAVNVDGVRILPNNAYNLQTDSAQHTLQGEGAAANSGRVLPMPQSALVMLYQAIAGKLPQIRKNTGRAMGWYQLSNGQIVLNAVNFGLIDRSDARALMQMVAEHYGEEWGQNPEAEQLFKDLLHGLLKTRSRQPQVRAPRVLAHEIGHMIDYIEDGKVARGNLIGHLKRLKAFTDKTLGTLDVKELRAESRELITWWRGVEAFENYFNTPAEMYAELFGVYLTDPGAMEQRAPSLYAAITGALDQHADIKKTWQHIQNLMNTGSEYTAALLDRLTETWSADAQTKAGRLMEKTRKALPGQTGELFRYFFTDRFGPITGVAIERAGAAKIKALDKQLTEHLITADQHAAQSKRLKEEVDRIKAAVKQYVHRDNIMRLMLADVNGSVMRVLKENNLDWKTLAVYAHMNRVIELQGRATALGVEPAEAHATLTEMEKAMGPERFRALETAWNNFRATYEKYVINDPDVQTMYGAQTIAMMRENAHYVTMKHRKSVAEIDALIKRQQEWKEAHPGEADPLDILLEFAVAGKGEKVGHKIHTLTGSLQYTEEPLTATLRKANAIITASKKNAVVAMLNDFFQETGYDQYARAEKTLVGIKKIGDGGPLKTVTFMKDGKVQGMHVSKWIEKAINYQTTYLGAFGKTARWITSFFTTNNPAFLEPAYMKDKQAVVKLIDGLYRSPLNSIPIIGETIGLFTRYIPPKVMRHMPRWFFNKHTLEYYEASARRAAIMIQNGNFAEELDRAAALREQGKTTVAETIEYEAHIAKWMLAKGALLSTNSSIEHEYTEPDVNHLMRQYGLDIDGADPDMTGKQKAAARVRKSIDAYKNLSEIREFTTKIITAMYLDQVRTDLSDNQKVKLITEHGGSPDFNQRGAAATLIEFFLQPFWNARQKGFIRTFQAAKDHPGDWILKQSLYTIFPATVTWMLAHGALGKLIRKYFDDDEEKMRATPIAQVVDWLDDLHERYRNVGRYFGEKYLTVPLPYGDPKTGASLCFTLPLDDESVALRMFANHALNTYGPALFPGTQPRANPNALTDISKEVVDNILPNLQSKGALIELINPFIQTFALGENPYDSFRGRTLLSDDEFAARWLTSHAAGTLTKELWNSLPTAIAYRFKDKTAESPAGSDDGLLQFMNLPFVQPALGRYIRFVHGGRDESLRALRQLDEEQQATLRLHAHDDYLRYQRTGKLDSPTIELMRTDAYYNRAFLNELKKDTRHTQKVNGFSLDEIKRISTLHDTTRRQTAYDTLLQ